jgi:uncharacterized damage-inducible protein DinB
MKDERFIEIQVQKGRQAREKFNREFSGISENQLNWKPSPEKWSIGQCLEHLVNSDSSYFPTFKTIGEGTYKMSFWARYSPLTNFFGRTFKKQLSEDIKIKLKAPKKFQPTKSNLTLDIVKRYEGNLDALLVLFSKCKGADLDKTIIASPITSIVTYSLRDTITFLMQHEHRHLNQAIRVKQHEGFPKF